MTNTCSLPTNKCPVSIQDCQVRGRSAWFPTFRLGWNHSVVRNSFQYKPWKEKVGWHQVSVSQTSHWRIQVDATSLTIVTSNISTEEKRNKPVSSLRTMLQNEAWRNIENEAWRNGKFWRRFRLWCWQHHWQLWQEIGWQQISDVSLKLILKPHTALYWCITHFEVTCLDLLFVLCWNMCTWGESSRIVTDRA